MSPHFKMPLQRQLVTDRLHIWQLGRHDRGTAVLQMSLTYFCDIGRPLKENF